MSGGAALAPSVPPGSADDARPSPERVAPAAQRAADTVADATPLTLTASTLSLGLFLGGVVATLHVLNGAAQLVKLYAGDFGLKATFLELFLVNSEGKVPTWYSTLALASCAFLAVVIAYASIRGRGPSGVRWLLLALVFVAMSFDEYAELHPSVGGPLPELVGTSGGTIGFGWVANGALFVGLFGLLYADLLLRLPDPARMLLLAGGAIFVAGALGMEVVGGRIDASRGSDGAAYAAAASVEEVLEMTGIVLVICALWCYLGHICREVCFRLTP